MTDTIHTIELFPGVQFRKDMSKPLGNRWCFLHEEHWLIAKLAYADDLMLDHIAEVTRQRDLLIAENERLALELKDFQWGASVEANAGDEARAEANRLKAENEVLRLPAARYNWLRDRDLDTIVIGGIFAGRTPDNVVINGVDLDRAIDAEIASDAKSDPENDLLVIPIAGTEVWTPIVKPWKEIAEPVADADRLCHAPNCYNCEGTGRDPFGSGLCTENDDFPF